MLIDESPKLDFNDVLLVPQRSTLVSRKQAKLEREFTFKWSNTNWKGVPIIASNMDTVGTFKAWGALKKFDMLTCLHKHYSINDWKDFTNSVHRISNSSFYHQDPEKRLDNIIISIGIKEEDLKKLKTIHEILKSNYEKAQPWICIDVANGYSEYFINFVRKVRKEYPSSVIIAGNVVTGEMTQELILNGADIVKVGIGSGCFTPGTKVITKDGEKNIEDVKEGDVVITHMGNWQKVTNAFKYQEEKKIISVNGIKSTAHHEYYVVDKKYKDVLTDDNIHEYAEWIEAEDLDKEKHFLLKHN